MNLNEINVNSEGINVKSEEIIVNSDKKHCKFRKSHCKFRNTYVCWTIFIYKHVKIFAVNHMCIDIGILVYACKFHWISLYMYQNKRPHSQHDSISLPQRRKDKHNSASASNLRTMQFHKAE